MFWECSIVNNMVNLHWLRACGDVLMCVMIVEQFKIQRDDTRLFLIKKDKLVAFAKVATLNPLWLASQK